MSDPVLAFLLVIAAAAVLAIAHWFRSLDLTLVRDARNPLFAGALAGVVLLLVDASGHLARAVLTGILLTLAALYVRLTGSESEPADGMAIGAMTGLAASVPLLISGRGGLGEIAACFLAGAVAGYGVTFALSHVSDALRQAAFDALTAVVASGAAILPAIAAELHVAERTVAVAALSVVPAAVVATVFQRWPTVKAELSEEAALGVMDISDVRRTAHPLRRLGRGGWLDAAAHREFVRVATHLAMRKRQQRSRPEEIARIYQLEVLKLRMHLRDAERVEMAMRAQAAAESSDTIADRNA